MTQLEKDSIKTWIRKLARITRDLNELAFEMADFDGGDYKFESYDNDSSVNYEKDPDPVCDIGDKHIEKPSMKPMTIEWLAGIEAEPVVKKNSSEKLQSLIQKVSQLEGIIANEATSAKTRTISKKKLQALRGHVSRHLKSREGVPWKSQVK